MSDKQNLEAVRRSIKELEPAIETMRQQKFLMKGVALGLFYGIIGNILVSHYYEVFKGTVIWQFEKLFWTNLISLIIVIVVILVVSWRWLVSLTKLEDSIRVFERFKQEFLTE